MVPLRQALVIIGALCTSACTPAPSSPDTTSVDTSTPADDPTEPVDEGPVWVDTPPPSWTAAEVEAQLNGAIAELGIPDPYLPRHTYEGMFDHASGDCPTGEGMNLPGDYQGCTTDDGTFFFGHGELALEAEPDTITSFYLLGDFYIVDPDGARFDGAGEVLHAVRDEGSFLLFETLITGIWSYGPAGGWMGTPTSQSLWVFGDHWGNAYHGTLHGAVDLGGVPIYFDWVNFQSSSCPDKPLSGLVQVRDPTGYWHAIDLGKGSCDGCGMDTWADGTELGEVCIDFGEHLIELIDTTLGDLPSVLE